MPVRPSVGALLATPPAATRSAVFANSELPAYFEVSPSPAGLRPAVSPAGAAPAPSPRAADYHSCLPGVATRPGRGGGGSGGAGSLAQAASASLFADYFAGREAAQAGVSTSGAVPPPRRASGGGVVGGVTAATAKLAVRRVQLLASEMREGDGGRLHTVYRVRARVGPFECTTYRRFSAFLELHRSLKAALPASAKLPRSRPLRNERLQIQPHKHTEGRIRLLQKYVDELCAVPEASESAELAAFFWPEAGDGSVVAPDGSKGTLF